MGNLFQESVADLLVYNFENVLLFSLTQQKSIYFNQQKSIFLLGLTF